MKCDQKICTNMGRLMTSYLSVEYRPGLGQISQGVLSPFLRCLFQDKIKLKCISKAALGKVKSHIKGEKKALKES